MMSKLVSSILGVMASLVGLAESASLTPVADTTIFAFSPNNNLGDEPQLIVGSVAKNAPNNRARLLMRFDLSPIPAGATVTNASLSISVIKEQPGQVPQTVGVHRMLSDWVEGDRSGRQGSAALPGQSTWNSREHSQAEWGAPGGLSGTDFAAGASSRSSTDGPGNYSFPSTAEFVADVQTWLVNPSANHGWILISENEASAGSARRIHSRESTSAQPTLTIGYTLTPTPPVIVTFDSIGLSEGMAELRFQALAGNIYSVWYRNALEVPEWITLTNVISKLTDQAALVLDPLTEPARFYQLAITGQVD